MSPKSKDCVIGMDFGEKDPCERWDGKRIKSEVPSKDTWLDPLAASVLKDQKQFIKSKYTLAYEGIER